MIRRNCRTCIKLFDIVRSSNRKYVSNNGPFRFCGINTTGSMLGSLIPMDTNAVAPEGGFVLEPDGGYRVLKAGTYLLGATVAFGIVGVSPTATVQIIISDSDPPSTYGIFSSTIFNVQLNPYDATMNVQGVVTLPANARIFLFLENFTGLGIELTPSNVSPVLMELTTLYGHSV